MNKTDVQQSHSKRLSTAFFSVLLVLVVGLVPATTWAANGGAADQGSNTQATTKKTAVFTYDGEVKYSRLFSELRTQLRPAELNPVFSVVDPDGKSELIQEGVDKTLTPYNTYGQSTYQVYVNGITGTYLGDLSLQENVSVSNIENAGTYATYDKQEHKWVPEVKAALNKDFSDACYTVTYYRGDAVTTDFKSAGDITVKIQGKKTASYDYSYVNETRTYTIQQAEGAPKVSFVEDQVYTYDGKAHGEPVTSDDDGVFVRYSIDDEFAELLPEVPTITTVSGNTKHKVTFEATSTNYKETVRDSYTIQVKPAEITVTVKGESATATYDGKEQSVDAGFQVTGVEGDAKDLYKTSDIALTETGKAKKATGKDAGTHYMGLTADDFTNNDWNFRVTYKIEDGYLTIGKLATTVAVKGNSATVDYNGQEQKVSGFTATADSELYDAKSVALKEGFSAYAEGTDAGSYGMGLDADYFVNNDENFDVTFKVEDGSLTVKPLATTVAVKGNSATVDYNGQEQKVSGFTATADSELYDAKSVALKEGFSAYAEGTDAGSYGMGLDADCFVNNDENFDVTFKVEDGTLTVKPLDITVSVKGDTETVAYNGEDQSFSSFSVSSDCDFYDAGNAQLKEGVSAIAMGKAAGTYYMGLTADSFVNGDENFNVAFDVKDGALNIVPADVTVNVKGNAATVTYNGEKQQVTGYTATTDSRLYDLSNVVLKAGFSDIAEGTEPGTYTMGLASDSFDNVDDNFNVTWNFQGDGALTITKADAPKADTGNNGGTSDKKVAKDSNKSVSVPKTGDATLSTGVASVAAAGALVAVVAARKLRNSNR